MRTIAIMAACGALAGAILGALDGGSIALGAGAMFFDRTEMWRTAASAVGLCAVAAMFLAILAGAPIELAGRRAGVLGGSFPKAFCAATALPLAGLGGVGLWLLTRGPQASRIPLRGLLVVSAAAISGLVVSAGAVALVRWAARSRRRRGVVGLLCLAAASGLHAVDATVLVRLYPAFHAGLTLAASAVLIVGLRLNAPAIRGRLGIAAVVALLIALALPSGVVSLSYLRAHANPRFVVSEKAAAAADVLSLAERAPGFAPKRRAVAAADAEHLGGALAGSAPRIARPGAPVVLISVDAMRYDRVGPRAVDKEIAPRIDAFFDTATVFDRAYTAIPHTSYAVTSFLTGKYIHALRDVPGSPEAHEALPEILRRFRYKSGGFFTKAVFFIDRARFEPYLRKGYGFDLSKIEYETPARERVAQTIEFLEKQRADGALAFTWTHFFEPHEPYDPSCTRLGASDERRYDCEIATVDEALGPLLDYLDTVMKNAIVIITADHGEEFGDHGGRYHGTTLYDEQVRVPLAIRVPGVPHRVVPEPVGLVDLVGTVMSLLDLPIPARVRSRDLSPLIAGARDPDHAAFTEVEDSLMVVRGARKLIWDRATDTARLYDLAADPKETVSIAEREPEEVQSLLALARAFDASHAPIELRPVAASSGETSWPASVQRAMAGDAAALPELLALVGADTPAPVRRKAAELASKLRTGPADEALRDAARRSADDPETAAWLAAARIVSGDPEAAGDLEEVLPALPADSEVWRNAALVLLESAPKNEAAIEAAVAIAGAESAPVEDRQRALRLFAANRTRASERTAEAALSSYQLALDAANVLASIGSKRALPGLIARLARERFPERRAAIIGALLPFRDRRTIAPIAAELARDATSPGALAALVALGAKTDVTRPIRLRATGEALFLRAPGSDVLWCRLDAVRRVVVATAARADGGAVRITCNNAPLGEIPVASGDAEGYLDITNCAATEKGLIAIRALPHPEDLDVELRAVAAMGKP